MVEATGSAGWLDGVPLGSMLVVDCLGTCLGLALLEAWDETSSGGTAMTDAEELPLGCAAEFETRSAALVDALAARAGDTIVVTNEVGSGVVPSLRHRPRLPR